MVTGGNTTRRLSMMEDQKKYSEAIEKIVPSWQSIENTGIAMCPNVIDAKDQADSLKCRVDGFIKANGALSMLSGLTGAGGSCPEPQAPAAADTASCPTEAKSAGVKDMLSKNSGMLGWILAAGGGLVVCLGAGGAVAAKTMQGGDGAEELEEDEEAEELQGGAE
eukprot:gnl/TRDRNA2_/TRDRNA2_121485_c0_seq1.p1 gnl/TRDRNA2_/TRDRNA2_121485_c0~~gnl/TRDRNA2_/TRDRNA2_121485_c0_seq1.p1  ORF type:complete len:185 (+),score=34.85 gnl/TRDRNA2_/TRDRNA2_121485_c0_seq1:62-556(+)